MQSLSARFRKPFPDPSERARVWEEVGRAGIAIFLFGNKLVRGDVQKSDGMRREFEIAASKNLILVPIGVTSSISADLATEFLRSGGDPNNSDVNATVAALLDPVVDLMSLIEPIVSLVSRLRQGSK